VELSGDRSSSSIYSRYVSFWLNAMNPAGAIIDNNALSQFGASFWKRDPLKAMMLHDISTYLSGDILTKLDRAAMSISLETRLPLLDHSVVEFCLNIPSKFHTMDGRGKWLGRQLLARYLPTDLIERKKTGFAAPIDEWLRGPLKVWADRLLDREKLANHGILDADTVAQEWDWHKENRIQRGQALWGVLMFQAWADKHRSL